MNHVSRLIGALFGAALVGWPTFVLVGPEPPAQLGALMATLMAGLSGWLAVYCDELRLRLYKLER